jgi:hypothetical protein
VPRCGRASQRGASASHLSLGGTRISAPLGRGGLTTRDSQGPVPIKIWERSSGSASHQLVVSNNPLLPSSLALPMTSLAKASTVSWSTNDAGVTTIELNRPLKRNALSQDMIDELTRALELLDHDVNVRAVVLTSIGQTPFCGMVRL